MHGADGTYALVISGGRVVIWGTSFLGTVPVPPPAQSGLAAAGAGAVEWALLLKG
ncbi:MAG: hypothetical protein ACKOT0_13235 [bacterium]